MHALRLATVTLDRTRREFAAVGIVPFVCLPRDGVDNAVAVPSHNGICIIFQGVGDFAVIVAVSPDANDTLSLRLGVFNLPVYPLAAFRLRRHVNDEDASPINLWSENF